MTCAVWAVSITTSTLPHRDLCFSATWGLKLPFLLLLCLLLLQSLTIPIIPGDTLQPLLEITVCQLPAYQWIAQGRVLSVRTWENKTLCQWPARSEDPSSAAHCVSTHLCGGSCNAASLNGSKYLETGCFLEELRDLKQQVGAVAKGLDWNQVCRLLLSARLGDGERAMLTNDDERGLGCVGARVAKVSDKHEALFVWSCWNKGFLIWAPLWVPRFLQRNTKIQSLGWD